MNFKNEPFADFSLKEVREDYSLALNKLTSALSESPIVVKPVILGKEVDCSQNYLRPDPSTNKSTVAKVFMADEKIAEQALQSADKSREKWRKTPIETRCSVIKKAAALMRERRKELFALLVLEAGKPWKESDADVCEAIDFCEYYAEQMSILGIKIKTDNIPGEDNFYSYQPRGIAVIISPWNFPLAITCGMTAAALVAGNTAIIKPSRQTSAIALTLHKIFLEAGVPEDVLSFLPGPGSLVGRILVDDPRVSLYVFTGSKEVGLEIIERAAKVHAGQRHVKRVIAEMGGKNAIIVDEDADLDEAVKGIIYSAFGYSGQKCSACSRVIAVGSCYEILLERLASATTDIIVGAASDPAVLLGPVIDESSQKRILGIIEESEKTERLLVKGNVPSSGYFVPATIFRDVDPNGTLWREEVFGPVLACLKAASISDAIDIANDCDYALTGGIYSRSPSNIEKVKDDMEVGNLYVNRSCTGALVNRQPFGGFKLSGVGSKAGGKDYLLQFLEPRSVSENTMRRGFAPEE